MVLSELILLPTDCYILWLLIDPLKDMFFITFYNRILLYYIYYIIKVIIFIYDQPYRWRGSNTFNM